LGKNDKQLCCPFFNNIFSNKNLQNRNKTCYLVKKGRLIHKNIKYIHPENSICIENLSLEEINYVFNQCNVFYSYDPNSLYIIYAAVCGCTAIVYEIDGVSEKDYFNSLILNFDNKIYNKGIVYGINEKKQNHILLQNHTLLQNNIKQLKNLLQNQSNTNNEEYYRKLFRMIEEKTIPEFLKEIKGLIHL
jgi:hypothetical protein